MNGIDHCDSNIAKGDCAALVKADDRHSFAFLKPAHQIILANQGNVQLFRQAHHICHMIKMRMRQEDMRGTCHSCLMLIFWKNRISREPGINQKCLIGNFNAK